MYIFSYPLPHKWAVPKIIMIHDDAVVCTYNRVNVLLTFLSESKAAERTYTVLIIAELRGDMATLCLLCLRVRAFVCVIYHTLIFTVASSTMRKKHLQN